jgi:hypothetical protein
MEKIKTQEVPYICHRKVDTPSCLFISWHNFQKDMVGSITCHITSIFHQCFDIEFFDVATPLWGKCEDETHTPKSGNLESFGTPENSELDCRGQNTLHWSVVYNVGKVLKCRYRKWLCMSHSDIYNTSYGRKKGRESNWQFDSWSLKVRNRPDPGVFRWSTRHHWKALEESYSQSEVWARSYELPKSQKSKPG